MRGEGGHVSSHHARARVILSALSVVGAPDPTALRAGDTYPSSCTARTGRVRAARFATRRGEDYERVRRRPVCDLTTSSPSRPSLESWPRDKDDLGQPARSPKLGANADAVRPFHPVRDAESTSDLLAPLGGSTDARGLPRTLVALRWYVARSSHFCKFVFAVVDCFSFLQFNHICAHTCTVLGIGKYQICFPCLPFFKNKGNKLT